MTIEELAHALRAHGATVLNTGHTLKTRKPYVELLAGKAGACDKVGVAKSDKGTSYTRDGNTVFRVYLSEKMASTPAPDLSGLPSVQTVPAAPRRWNGRCSVCGESNPRITTIAGGTVCDDCV